MIVVRPMQIKDLEQVQAIDQASFSMPWPASAYRYELTENPLSLLWVAEDDQLESDQQLVGLTVVWLIVDEGHIATIAVHPSHRRQGIALQLMAAALQGAAERGMSQMTLEVRADNIAAQGVYQRLGFEEVGRRPRYYRDNNEDALIMTLYHLPQRYQEWRSSGTWETPGTKAG